MIPFGREEGHHLLTAIIAVIGAAGSSILNAEAAVLKGYI